MLRVALPNDGRLAEPAAAMMLGAGYRQRTDSRDLQVIDEDNDIEFYYLQPRDVATYVGSGDLHLGITGQDLMEESGSHVRHTVKLGFGVSQCRFAIPRSEDWLVEDLDGKSIATSYPQLVRSYLSGKRIGATIIKLDGEAEIAVELGLADAIAEVVSSGSVLQQHGLKAIGDPIAESEAVLIEREPRRDRVVSDRTQAQKVIFTERVRATAYAHHHVLINYWCREVDLGILEKISPRLQAGADSSIDTSWVVVPSMVLKRELNAVIDELKANGAAAITSSEIQSFHALGSEHEKSRPTSWGVPAASPGRAG
jgi:ATP phosphoribosyltransferase